VLLLASGCGLILGIEDSQEAALSSEGGTADTDGGAELDGSTATDARVAITDGRTDASTDATAPPFVCYLDIDAGDGGDAGTATIDGVVYDPSGHLKLANVPVYVPSGPLQPLTRGLPTSCTACRTSLNPAIAATSDENGYFQLKNVPNGTQTLVIQTGRWRRTLQVNVCGDVTLQATDTRLPRTHLEGDIPWIAIVTGQEDPIECLFAKMVDPNEFYVGPSSHHIDLFKLNGLDYSSPLSGGNALWADPAKLAQYDMVILPCEGNVYDKADSGALKNVQAYADQGGTVFTTHYGFLEWLSNPSSEWYSQAASSGNGGPATSNVTAVVNQAGSFKNQLLAKWLYVLNPLSTQGQLPLTAAASDVKSVDPSVNVVLTAPGTNTPTSYQYFTFATPVGATQQTQCGKVMFTDFHLSKASALQAGNTGVFPSACALGNPFSAQEEALLWAIFDQPSCVKF
jgi:hypothetical protein